MIDREEHVRTMLQDLGPELAPDALARVSAVFTRNAELAALILDFDLPEDVEPAAIFRL